MSAVPQARAVAPRCPVCDGDADHKATMTVDAATVAAVSPGSVYECVHCALGFVHPRPAPAPGPSIERLDRPVRMPHVLSRLRARLARAVDQGVSLCSVIEDELAPRSDIVEIGGVSGTLMHELAGRGYRVVGLRMHEGSVDVPRSQEPGSCDGVVFSHVVEHLVDPVRALTAAAALLKPGGRLFCEVPNNEALIARRTGHGWDHLDIARHLNFFTERSLASLVRNAGLVVKRVYFSGYGRYFDDSSWRLLAQTAAARARVKYGSVGIVAGWPPALI
jgi:SAM-dependent methyltransferase